MTEPVCELDLARMRRDRVAKLDAAMDAAGVDTLRAVRPTERLVRDRRPRARGRSHARVVVARGRGARAGRAVAAPLHRLPRRRARRAARRVPAPRDRGRDRGGRGRARRARSAGAVGDRRRAVPAVGRAARPRARRRGHGASAPAKITKTPDELECIRRAQAINEAAMRVVRPLAKPGRAADRAVGRVPARGRRARRDREHRRPRVPGDAARRSRTVRTASPASPSSRSRPRDEPLRAGDVLWIDTGINLHGYASDFGATWIVGHDPNDVRARSVRAVARGRRPRAGAREAGRDRGRSRRGRAPRRRPAPVALVLLPRARHRHRQRGDAVRRDRPRRRVRRGARAAAGHGARVRTGDLGRRRRRPPLRGDRRGDRRRLRAPVDAGRRSTTAVRA